MITHVKLCYSAIQKQLGFWMHIYPNVSWTKIHDIKNATAETFLDHYGKDVVGGAVVFSMAGTSWSPRPRAATGSRCNISGAAWLYKSSYHENIANIWERKLIMMEKTGKEKKALFLCHRRFLGQSLKTWSFKVKIDKRCTQFYLKLKKNYHV